MSDEEIVSFTYYQIVLGISFVTCFFIHHVLSPWIFKRYSFYSKLTKDKQMEWDSRIVSTLHAGTVSILCLICLKNDHEIWEEPINYESFIGSIAMSISFGYFLCDILSMPMYWRDTQLILFIIHHSAAMGGIYGVLKFRGCSFFGVFRLITELSTPFANQRWFFRTAGISSTRRRVALSTIIFTALFILTRNGLIIPYWIISLRAFSSKALEDATKRVPYMKWMCYGVPGALDLLNIYWSKDVYMVGYRALKYFRDADWKTDLDKAKDRVARIKNTFSNFKLHDDDGDSADERFFDSNRGRLLKRLTNRLPLPRSASVNNVKKHFQNYFSNDTLTDEFSDLDIPDGKVNND